MGNVKRIVVLGSTGSIGCQTLDVVARHGGRFEIAGLTADTSWERMAEQLEAVAPRKVALRDSKAAACLRAHLRERGLHPGLEVLEGDEGVVEVAAMPDVEMAVVALVGVSGLLPTLRAIETGKDIALANKETLVVGGTLVKEAARRKNVQLLPVDSEHSALFQCLVGEDRERVSRLILTCSGGPFRTWPEERVRQATVRDALNHPTWSMGSKITVDSATLMNKGFEVIEAQHLYDTPYDQIDVVVHPESIVHSFVEYIDGSVLCQLGPPDMRLPIQYAMAWPERLGPPWKRLDFREVARLTFEEPRRALFPCLGYGFEAGRQGGTMPCALNAANEIAVEMFLQERIRFVEIPEIIARTMEQHRFLPNPTLGDLLETDAWCRAHARENVLSTSGQDRPH